MKVGSGGGIKTIQRGKVTISSTQDITIGEVNMDKSTLNITSAVGMWKGQSSGSTTTGASSITIEFIDSTTIRLSDYTLGSPLVTWEVVEYA